MKNKFKSLVFLLALGLIFAGCKKDRPKKSQNEKSVVIKTEDQIEDENIAKDFYDLVASTNKDLAEDEKTFLAELLKNIDENKAENISKNLGGELKNEVGGDLRVLQDKLLPLAISGHITDIESIEKTDKTYLITCPCEDDTLLIEAAMDDNKLTKLDLRLKSTVEKKEELEKDNQAFIDKSYEIIDALRNKDKDLFAKDVKGLSLEDDKFDEMYEGLTHDLSIAGNILTDKAEAKVSFADDLIKDAPVDQNIVEVRLVYTFEHIEKIVYDFAYAEDMTLLSLGVSPDED